MADNYLETRYAEVFENNSNRNKLAFARPCLDLLIRKSATSQSEPSEYKIHQLQAEAILRSVELAFEKGTVCFTINEDGSALLHIKSDDKFVQGRIAQTIILKAAEMGLAYSLIDSNLIKLFK